MTKKGSRKEKEEYRRLRVIEVRYNKIVRITQDENEHIGEAFREILKVIEGR